MTVYSRALGLVVLAAWAGEYAADVLLGTWTLQYSLPLQLTDAVSLATVLALWSRRTIFIELVYFWSLTASLQATLTPDLAQNFPSIYYFTYFSYHIGAVAAVCLLVFGLRLYPRPRAAWRVFAVTVGWATVAGLGDVVTGGNYMYLRVKPAHSSLLSVMGAWPWYLASTAALGLGMLLVLQALANWLHRRDASLPVPSGTVADRGVARTGQARA